MIVVFFIIDFDKYIASYDSLYIHSYFLALNYLNLIELYITRIILLVCFII